MDLALATPPSSGRRTSLILRSVGDFIVSLLTSPPSTLGVAKSSEFQLKTCRLVTILSVSFAVAAGVLASGGAVSARQYFDVLHVFSPATDGGYSSAARCVFRDELARARPVSRGL